MTLFRRNVSVAVFAAVTAGVTWAVATGMVVNYPATIHTTVDLGSETITSVSVQVFVPGQFDDRTTATVVGPGPRVIDVSVDGGNWADVDGDPATDDDPGEAYDVQVDAYLSNPLSDQTFLRFQRTTSTQVNNTTSTPSATVPLSFVYPLTYRANASISVIGDATIDSYYLYAYASNPVVGVSYSAQTSKYAVLQTTATTWLPMAPATSVQVYGWANLRYPDGSISQRYLASQVRDLSAGSASVDWTIDLTINGHLEGTIAIDSPDATPSSYQVVYTGVSSSTSGIYGWVPVDPGSLQYAVDLSPGEYDVQLRTVYNSGASSQSETQRSRITITQGATTVKNFDDSFGILQWPLTISGFFTNSDLNYAYSTIRGPDYGNYSYSWQLTGGDFDHVVSFGSWQRYYSYWRFYNISDPLIPLDTDIFRWTYDDPTLPPVIVNSHGSTSSAPEQVSLARANIFFDVVEAPGAPAIQLRNPRIEARKLDYNPDGSLRRDSRVRARGSSTLQERSQFVMVAEPGTYQIINATAIVNGQEASFGTGTIVFGDPVVTEAGSPEVVLADETQGSYLNLSLAFEDVSAGGVTTVVENPLGPPPPEGFSMACQDPVLDDNGHSICEPIYYDISSTAEWTGVAKVCVRRRSILPNGLAEELLKLNHYNASTTAWEPLPAPSDGTPAFRDCAADLAACNCTDAVTCGIDYSQDPSINVYQVCGDTTSFSPFAVFQGKLQFDNTVDGIEYTGPTGPPSLQQWVVPGAGTYRITAAGAQGATPTSSTTLHGGCGAEVTGDFTLNEGDIIGILVGQKGTAATNSAGGGGGTFVTKNGAALLIAGGGGGVRSGAMVDGRHGTLRSGGTAGSTSSTYASGFIAGGTDGGGGARVSSYGSGGGGWSGDGASDGNFGEGGFSYLGAGRGKGGSAKTCSGGLAHGGYGGGGAGNGCFGGGGGGGYSGGGGGRVAGGGGSLNNGSNPHGREGPPACTVNGHGMVTIDYLHP